MVIETNKKEFSEKIEGACIVDFFATWCPPCKMLAPVFEKVSEEYKEKLKFYKINVDNDGKIAEKYNIMHVPTLVLFKNGEPVNKVSGFISEKELTNFINQAI